MRARERCRRWERRALERERFRRPCDPKLIGALVARQGHATVLKGGVPPRPLIAFDAMSTSTLPADAAACTEARRPTGKSRDNGVDRAGSVSLEPADVHRRPARRTAATSSRSSSATSRSTWSRSLNCSKAAMVNEDWPPLSRGRLMGLTRWYNEGLFLTYGPEHHRQRDELWKPLFDDPQVTDIAVERTRKLADSWVEGQPLEMYKTMRSNCWAIDWQALTGTDLDARARHPRGARARRRGPRVARPAVRPVALELAAPAEQEDAGGQAQAGLAGHADDGRAPRAQRRRPGRRPRRLPHAARPPGRRAGLDHDRRAGPRHVQDVLRRRPAARAVHLDAAPARPSRPTSRPSGTTSSTPCSVAAP